MSFETGLAAYEVGATVALAQLRIGLTLIADAANYLEVGRDAGPSGDTSVSTRCPTKRRSPNNLSESATPERSVRHERAGSHRPGEDRSGSATADHSDHP
jgi:hypothetical protein